MYIGIYGNTNNGMRCVIDSSDASEFTVENALKIISDRERFTGESESVFNFMVKLDWSRTIDKIVNWSENTMSTKKVEQERSTNTYTECVKERQRERVRTTSTQCDWTVIERFLLDNERIVHSIILFIECGNSFSSIVWYIHWCSGIAENTLT